MKMFRMNFDAVTILAGEKRTVECQAGLHISLSLPNATDNTMIPPPVMKESISYAILA